MKKLSITLCLVIFAGCANENLPLRSQIQPGMTITEVWDLYGYDFSKPETHTNKVYYENIGEEVTGKCILKTYFSYI